MESPVDRCETHPERIRAFPIAAIVLIAAIAGTFSLVMNGGPKPIGAPPASEAEAVLTVTSPTDRETLRKEFFEREVLPAIAQTDQQNREAAERCIERLSRLIDQYRQGVDPFVNDLTSIKTRLGIVRRMPAAWWKEDRSVEAYVQTKFEQHLFSEQQLINDVGAALDGFRDEVDANQRRMLTQIRASLEISDLPEIRVEDDDAFLASVANQLQTYSSQQGTSSLQNGLTVLVLSEAGSYAAMSLASGLLARFGTTAATTAAAAGGATAGASAAGAGSGSLAGPVGTAVGLGVGLVIGLTIDWWMTEKFEEELSGNLHQYLDRLKQSILDGPGDESGSSSGAATQPSLGIKRALPELCDQLRDAYEQRFLNQIVELERMGEKSAANVMDSIEKSKHRPLARLIAALGIRNVGVQSAEILADEFGTLDNLRKAEKETLEKIDQIGPVMAESIYEHFRDKNNKHVIDEMLKLGVSPEKQKSTQKSAVLAGKTIVVTGTLVNFTRQQIQQMIKAHGGKVSSSVSKKTSFVIAGAEAGSKLDKAQKLGVEAITEEQFIEMIRD